VEYSLKIIGLSHFNENCVSSRIPVICIDSEPSSAPYHTCMCTLHLDMMVC
jgi:hypothetical protein